jgi:hypothetical protein
MPHTTRPFQRYQSASYAWKRFVVVLGLLLMLPVVWLYFDLDYRQPFDGQKQGSNTNNDNNNNNVDNGVATITKTDVRMCVTIRFTLDVQRIAQPLTASTP